MMTFRPLRILSISALISIHVRAGQDDWNFTWPTVTSQCETVTVSITGGVPPWELEILPIGQQPIFWEIYDPGYPVNASYPFTETIPLQLEPGTAYVVIIYDSQGYNEAPFNPTPIQIVQPSNDTACLAAAVHSRKIFDFQVYGTLAECDYSLAVAWRNTSSNSSESLPHSFTIAPLDASYNPWDWVLGDSIKRGDTEILRVNMTSGTRFTVMMNGGFLGEGGVGQIYEVSSAGNADCIAQQAMNRSDWPSGLQVNPVSPTKTSWGPLPTPTPNDNSTDIPDTQIPPQPPSPPPTPSPPPKGISAGAIAGIAVGAAAVTAAIIAFILFYIRRKRRQNRAADQGNVDLVGGSGGGAGHVEPRVVPFRSTSTSGSMPTMGYTPRRTQSGYEAGEMVQTDPNFGRRGVDTPGSVPFPTPGPGFFRLAGARDSSTGTQSEAGDQSSHVTPLPNRAAPLRGLSDSSSSENDPTSPDASMADGYHISPSASSGASSADTKAGYPRGFTSTTTSATSQHPLPPIPLGSQDPTEFRRHTDAGEIYDQGGHHGGVVDLPPLYTDVSAHRAGTPKQQQQQQQQQ